MKKSLAKILTLACLLVPLSALAGTQTLYSCYQSLGKPWGSVTERALEAAKYGIWHYEGTAEQNTALTGILCPPEGSLGFSVVTDYQKGLSSPMTTDQTFVPVTSLTLKDGTVLSMSLLGDKVFLTIEPGGTNEEVVMCTAIDGTTKRFTGCSRGLAFSGPTTTSVSANQKTHSSGSAVVMSNVHYVYQQFLDINTGSTQTLNGVYTFFNFPAVTSTTAAPTSNDQLTSKYYVDTQLANGFSCSSASSSLGIQCSGTPAVFGVNPSSTGSLAFDTIGRLYVNPIFNLPATFNAPVTVNASSTFTATTTFSGNVSLNTTVSGGTSITNKNYVDDSISYNTATGTAGITITAGQSLYVSTTGTLFLSSSAVTSTSYGFVGIATTGGTVGQTISYARPGGVVDNLSGLSAGRLVYLSDTPGVLSHTKGTVNVRVGIMLSSSRMQIMSPLIRQVASGSFFTPAFDGSGVTVTLGWRPTKVTMVSVPGNIVSEGYAIQNSDGTLTQYSIGTHPGSAGQLQWEAASTSILSGQDTSNNQYFVTAAFTTTGFTVTANTVSGTPGGAPWKFFYTAEYEDE